MERKQPAKPINYLALSKTKPTDDADYIPAPRPMFQPLGYRDAFADIVYKLRLLGTPDSKICDFFEIDQKTLRRWINQIPAFAEQYRLGGQAADAQVAAALFKRAVGYTQQSVKIFHSNMTGETTVVPYEEEVAGDVAAQKLWLTNRQPYLWKDKVNVEQTGKDGAPLLPPIVILNAVKAGD